jgi:hypothetical protein
MKYHILLQVTINAAPTDLAGAARKGFDAIANKFNSGEPLTIHLLPQDGSPEALLQDQILDACFQAHSVPKL